MSVSRKLRSVNPYINQPNFAIILVHEKCYPSSCIFTIHDFDCLTSVSIFRALFVAGRKSQFSVKRSAIMKLVVRLSPRFTSVLWNNCLGGVR